ncbi:MAG TPA: penicillin-insensitive murein endopeptidase [Hyphomicrobiaceae bacterium]|nr:penicillin-insensitive murein endopeptidase [Hyphomicrobiaceae bacterium]
MSCTPSAAVCAILAGALALMPVASSARAGQPVKGGAAAAPAPEKAAPEATVEAAAAPQKAAPVEAKKLFGAAGTSAALAPRAIGFYARGCLAGAEPLPIDGPAWQAMRLSRNRNWGHPTLVRLIERLGTEASEKDGWPGLLVGDISQPRGGPMLTGHASHQIGLDADIWLTPMPDRRLSEKEREDLAATSMLATDGLSVDPKIWTATHARLIIRAASYPEVDRIFVHPAIKKAMCQQTGIDRTHLRKIQPYWGHHYHFHIRISCPAGSVGCANQPARPADDGCGKEVDDWMVQLRKPPKPVAPGPKAPPKPGLLLEQLPQECRTVLEAASGQVPPHAVSSGTQQEPASKAADAR